MGAGGDTGVATSSCNYHPLMLSSAQASRKDGDAMTIREAAQRVGKSESALRRAIKARKLDAKLIQGRYDITEEALYAYAPKTKRLGANSQTPRRR